jgi:hypothetical protein
MIHRWCLSAIAAAALLAAGLSAPQAFVPAAAGTLEAPVILTEGGGYDNDAIAMARGYYRDPNYGSYAREPDRGYYPGWDRSYPSPYAYSYCPRQMVPIQLRNGRVVWRWQRVC